MPVEIDAVIETIDAIHELFPICRISDPLMQKRGDTVHHSLIRPSRNHSVGTSMPLLCFRSPSRPS